MAKIGEKKHNGCAFMGNLVKSESNQGKFANYLHIQLLAKFDCDLDM